MTNKWIVIADPGLDTAFAIALLFHDPRCDILGLIPTAGNISAEQATKNVHILVEQTDPPKWPKLARALPVEYGLNGRELHGPDGLGGKGYSCTELHNLELADKVIGEILAMHPEDGDVNVLCLGPLTTLARAFEREPKLAQQLGRVVCTGGTIREPGNAGPVSEFHFACDPIAAQTILHSDLLLTLVPLDVMRKLVFSPTDLLHLPETESRTCAFLRKVIPAGIRATSHFYGIEGFHLKDVMGVVAANRLDLLTTQPAKIDVETQGDLTRGMSVLDARTGFRPRPNVDLVTDADIDGIRNYISDILTLAR